MDYALRFFIGGLVVSFFALFWAMSCVRKVSPDCLVPPLLSPWEALDAAGAAWGSIGLAAFGAVIWWQATSTKAVVCIGFASLIWFAIVVGVWRLRRALPAPLRRLAD